MNEEEKALISAVVHEAASPFVGVVTDLVGAFGGDSLKQFRARKQERREKNERETLEVAGRLLTDRKVQPNSDASPENVEEILDAAKDCGSAELREMFARLLAAVFDASRSHLYRREFIKIVEQMEPLEADLLARFNTPSDYGPSRVDYFAHQMGRTRDEIVISVQHLFKLGLTTSDNGFHTSQPQLSPLGRQLLTVVS